MQCKCAYNSSLSLFGSSSQEVLLPPFGFPNICLASLINILVSSAIFSSATPSDQVVITKVVAANSAVMILVERGQIKLDELASHYISEFTGDGRETVTIKQLLTHTSGLRPTLPRANATLTMPFTAAEAPDSFIGFTGDTTYNLKVVKSIIDKR